MKPVCGSNYIHIFYTYHYLNHILRLSFLEPLLIGPRNWMYKAVMCVLFFFLLPWWNLNLPMSLHWSDIWILFLNLSNSDTVYFWNMIPFSSVTQSCHTLCDHMDCSTPGFPVYHQLPELAQTHVHWVGDAIQTSHPLSSPSSAFNLSQHQGHF